MMIGIHFSTFRCLHFLLVLFPHVISFSISKYHVGIRGNSDQGMSLRSASAKPHTEITPHGSSVVPGVTTRSTPTASSSSRSYDTVRTVTDQVGANDDDSLSSNTSVVSCWLLDVASITSSSTYPWTIESLAASAPLILGTNEDEQLNAGVGTAVLVVESTSTENCFYSGGPLPFGVGIWFTTNSTEQLGSFCGAGDSKGDGIDDNDDNDDNGIVWNVVSTNPCLHSSVSPAHLLLDLESLGPRTTTLPFSGTNSVTVQSYMDLQAELQELRDILKPHHTKRRRTAAAAGSRKTGISRKQRTKVQKRAIQLEKKTSDATIQDQRRKGNHYNVATDAAILRHRLEECGTCQITNITSGRLHIQTFVRHVVGDDGGQSKVHHHHHNKAIQGSALSEQVLTIPRRSNISTSLRMIVLSDTHGYESQFQKYGNETSGSYLKLPDADILIHCGDFDGPGRSLDCFLSAQNHIRTQIVIRGNHDPLQYSFSSGAQYITRRQTITLDDGTILDARPFVRSRRLPQAPLPDRCDIFVTHEPPFGICDRTYRNERVGSLTLRHAVESSVTLPPAVWLCGHIHEGRGAVWHSFANGLHSAAAAAAAAADAPASTVVVNAANANAGKAKRITMGPVILDLVPNDALSQV
jgi:predicted phosphodiesterase